jgi:1,4-dihydroxy-2-naphthoate octaprenyltransferase
VRCTFRQSLGASLAGLALTYTVGRAVLYGLATSRLPFMRTPKMDERATLGMALGMARGEAVLTALLWLAAATLWMTSGVIDPEARLWSVFMLVQSLPFVAAVAVSVVNAAEQMRHARAIYETSAAPVVATAAMQPAQ